MAPTEALSPHFALAEFVSPRDPERNSIPPAVLAHLRLLATDLLEPLRAAVEHPIVITSGWRSPAYNAQVGGAAKSEHVKGNAADIQAATLQEQLRLLAEASRLPACGGIGFYPDKHFCHVDRRTRRRPGLITTWMRRADGKYVMMPGYIMAQLRALGAKDLRG